MHPLEQRVDQVRRWWNRRALVEAVAWAMAVVVLACLVAGVVDYALRSTDRGLRILLSVALAGAIGYGVWRLARWWRRQRFTHLTAAQALQRVFPQLGDRLASAIEFLRQEEDDATAGSARLRRAVVADTTAALDQLPAEQAVEGRQTARAVAVAVAGFVLLALLAVFAPSAVRTAAARLAAPWNNVEWPRRHDLAFVDPPQLIARGDPLEVAVVDSSGTLPDDVAIEFRYQLDGRTRTERTWMQRVGSTMVARRENVERSLEYRATGGDHRTMAWHELKVIDRPSADQVSLVAHPPAYSGLPASPVRASARVLSGSAISLAARANQPLASAELVPESGDPIPLRIEGEQLELAPGSWQPTAEDRATPLRAKLRLESKNGLSGTIDLPPLEVVPDAPPTVEWSGRVGDWFVLPTARLPIAIAASDDLAVSSARLVATPSPSETTSEQPPIEITLMAEQQAPPGRDELPPAGLELDRHELEATLPLGEYDLSPGQVIELTAVASDFMPQTGSTTQPRRVHLITPAELDSRIAEHQAELLRLLEQALADQRAARTQATSIAAGDLASRETLDGLLTTRLTQQSVARTLTESQTGLIDRTGDLLEQLATNGLNSDELAERLQDIVSQVSELAGGPLPAAEAQITSIRKSLESQQQASELDGDFSALDSEQQAIIAVLQSLVEKVSAWSDADRFIREFARLEQDQRDLRERSLDALRRDIQSRTNRNAPEVQQKEFEQLADEQSELARRFDKLVQGMRQMARSGEATSEFKTRLENAAAAAESSQLSSQLSSASRELQQQQLGRAGETQQSAADAIRELVDRLQDRAPTDPGELASRLKDLQRQLAELAQQASDTPPGDKQGRQQLSDKLQQMSRELARHTAQQASQSAQNASSSAAPKQAQPRDQQRKDAEQTQKDIEQAQRELAQRIAELEAEQQQRVLDRLAQALDDLIPAQQQTLETTIALELIRQGAGGLEGDDAARTESLSDQQTGLAGQLDAALEGVEEKAVFQLALGGAADDMRQAARGLARRDTGRVTQNLELNALARMRHVLDILREPPPEPPEGEQQQNNGGGDGGGGQPQPPPLIELAEVKMLRWLQVELNGRTRQFEADLADSPQQAAEKRQAADRLSNEQQQLQELVREMMRRNNRDNDRSMRL